MAIINRNINGITRISEAKDDKQGIEEKIPRSISNKLDLLDNKLDGLYKTVYISRPDNRNNMNDIINKLDDSIDKLQSNELNVSGMSELLRRLDKSNKKSNTDELMAEVQSLVSDESLLSSLYNNDEMHKYILAQNYNYDMLCRFVPKLIDALELKRDNVLSADNFSKKFLNPVSVKSSKEETQKFTNNCKKLENKYDLAEFYNDTYMNVSKYGEDFLYIVPYKLAFERLLKRQNYRRNGAKLSQLTFMGEATDSVSSSQQAVTLLTEGFTKTKEFNEFKEKLSDDKLSKTKFSEDFEGFRLNLHFNDTNVLLDKLNERAVLSEKADLDKFASLSSVYENTYFNEASKYNSVFDDLGKIRTSTNTYYNDGLIVPNSLNKDKDPSKLDDNFIGAVLERIPRENIVPAYIGNVCLGYYYFEFKDDPTACGFCGGHHATYGISNAQHYAYHMAEDQQELAMKYICSKISQQIDTHFINSNKDLSEEIYAVLRYNDKFDITRVNDIGVTFLPAEDIIHCYFKLDETTHRGVSDLQRSLVPGMIYMLLYLSDVIGKITRSTDKRVYYVKQNIETNVARTMMNVIGQIKKGNLGMRQLESMNNILNVVGKYNDYIIPVGPSGDSPISFEVMQGQNIETPTDLMDKMLEETINPICPMEMVNASMQADFATRYSMANVRFMKTIFARQAICQRWISKSYTKLYNYEYLENYPYIEVLLPPPTYLTITNTQQMLDTVIQLGDKINDVELNDEDEKVKAEFKKLFLRNYLGTYIDFSNVERLIKTAQANVAANANPKVDDGEESDNFEEL